MMANFKKGTWSSKEDEILREYITEHGERKWFEIHRKTTLNRSGNNCQARWLKVLKPGLKKGPLTEEEKNTVNALQIQLGNDWAAIARQVPGRTNRDIRNFCEYRKRKMGKNGLPTLPIHRKADTPQMPTYEYEYEDPPQLPPGSYPGFFDEVAAFDPLPPAERQL